MKTDLFEIVCWPDVQHLMEIEGFRENSYLITDEKGLQEYGSSAYFVRHEWLSKNTESNNENRRSCPFCGSNGTMTGKDDNRHYCTECECYFDSDDITRESIRHTMSALLVNTSEEKPLTCSVRIGEDEAQGLSSLELPEVVSCFQAPDGTLWVNIYGCSELMEFDDIQTSDLQKILSEIQKEDKDSSLLGFPFTVMFDTDNNESFRILQPYGNDYKERIKTRVKSFLEKLKEEYKDEKIPNLTALEFIEGKVSISYNKGNLNPADEDGIEYCHLSFFEHPEVPGGPMRGYSSDYGWGYNTREYEPGYLKDYFTGEGTAFDDILMKTLWNNFIIPYLPTIHEVNFIEYYESR